MKKLLLACVVLSAIVFNGCEKDKVTAPTADFSLYQLDSAKVATFSQGKIDTLSNLFVSDYFIPLPEDLSTRVYKGKVVIKYTGSASDSKVVFTGDATHIYVADPATPPAGVSSSQSGVVYGGDIFAYTFPVGTYTITVISTNVGDKGNDVSRGIASKRIIVR